MIGKIGRFFLFATLPAVLAGCAGAGPGALRADTGTLRLSEIDEGTTVHMERGEALVVSLRQNPDECHEWDIEELDEEVLRFDRLNVLSDHPGVPCSGADMIFRFTAVAEGTVQLRLTYARGWIESETTFEVWVVVRE